MLFRPEGLIPSTQTQSRARTRACTTSRSTTCDAVDVTADATDADERRCSSRSSVRKEFGGLVAVNDVDFTVPRGAIVCLIGPNGAGKTTFFNMLTGVYKPTAGAIVFDGEDVTGKPPHAFTRARHRPHVPEHPPVPEHDRARERARRHALAAEGRDPRARSSGTPRVRREERGRARARARAARALRPAAARRTRSRGTSRTATSAGSRSRARSRRSRSCCCSTSRRPA